KALKEVVERGLLVTYFLRQDDPIVVDVCVGPPLTKDEIKNCGVPLMKPTQTIISIPSGRLRIDTPNTFRLNADAQANAEEYVKAHGKQPNDDDLESFGLEDKSGEVTVPPGDYVLTLYRVDFDKFDDDDDEDDETGFDGPGELVLLTPAKKIERPKRIPRVLEYGAGYQRVFGLRAWKMVDGTFHGLMIGGFASNFSWQHAEKLGLRRGQRIVLTHEGKPHDAIYLAGIEPRSNPDLASMVLGNALDKVVQAHPGLLTAAIHTESILKTPLMWIQTTEEGKYLSADRGTPLIVEATKDFFIPPPDDKEVSQGSFSGGVITGQVLASGTGGLELGCSAKTLKQLKPGKSDALQLEIHGTTVPVILLPDAEHRHRPYHIAGSAAKPSPDFPMRIFSYLIDGGDEVFRAMLGQSRAKEITRMLKEYKASCTFNSRDGYVPKDKAKGEALSKRWVEMWIEGISKWNTPGAMSAVLAPHWDDPKCTTLSCRMVAHPPANPFGAYKGASYMLRLMPE
ncbi:MAG: hypothetical protein IT367_19475, partial [Candidatus Hydrogenedentes bacterium]|nr:hypothetical protein [Candidatus Hydrogenedentota bacterium]